MADRPGGAHKKSNLSPKPAMKTLTTLLLTCLLTACGSVQYQPLATIDHIDHSRGYRLQNLFQNNQDDDLLLVLLISGGGSRAAAFGYGVLEVLAATPITGHGKTATMLEKTDLVHGVSGGSVLATYLALHGKETVPRFEREFLRQNLQSTVLRQLFSLANLPRLTSPQYGRGDLLAEELDRLLYHGATFADLATRRKGPFALIAIHRKPHTVLRRLTGHPKKWRSHFLGKPAPYNRVLSSATRLV